MSTPTPPTNYPSWLDYAIATMDTRGAYIDRLFDDGKAPTQDEMPPMARSNSPTLGHPKFPQAGPPDYDDSGATAMRAAASLRR